MKHIKSIIIALGLLVSAITQAQTTTALTFQWDQEDDMASLTNLVTRLRGIPIGGAAVTLGSVTNKNEITVQISSGVWEFYAENVTKDKDGQDLVSPPSNKVRTVIPKPPVNMRRKITIIIE